MLELRVLLYLIACALHGQEPDDCLLKGIDFDMVFRLASIHSLAAIACSSMENTHTFQNLEESLRKKWTDAKNKAIRKEILLSAELKSVSEELEKQKIWHMPLKGHVLKSYYPASYMREMADCDVLYDKRYSDTVKKAFTDRGYSCKSINKGNHDVYRKQPVYNFEMHRDLYYSEIYPEMAEYYRNIKARLLRDDNSLYRYHFSDDDFYIYIVSHIYKHYNNSGTGIRSLIDVYVLEKSSIIHDRKYVEIQLNKLGILDFEKTLSNLASAIFNKPALPVTDGLGESELMIYESVTRSATYGTVSKLVEKNIRKMSGDTGSISRFVKAKYLFSRLFPGREWCRKFYPMVYRWPVLLPALWIFRIVRGLTHYSMIISEFKSSLKLKI